jgi:sterol 14-demethylase
MPECFPDPNRYDPGRYDRGREEDKQIFAWIPFGAGHHRCVGSAFALMQLKAIFSDLLRHYDFELTQPHPSYENDHSKMVVQLKQPCRARYRRRQPASSAGTAGSQATKTTLSPGSFRVCVDMGLCQGHGVCATEAPDVFEVERESNKVVLHGEVQGEEQRARVELAVEHCPTRALSIESND